jgi:peptidoglycan/LPS O-acetylase OafA/YrhL
MAVGSGWGIWTRQRPVGAAFQVVPWHLLFVCMIGWSLLIGTSGWRWIVNWDVLRFFGHISYGLYLYHLLVFDGVDYLSGRFHWHWINTATLPGIFTRFAVAAALATFVASMSRKTIEDYFLRLKKIGAAPETILWA